MQEQTIPTSLEAILAELLDGIRRAPTLDEVNIAAGIAYETLQAKRGSE